MTKTKCVDSQHHLRWNSARYTCDVEKRRVCVIKARYDLVDGVRVGQVAVVMGGDARRRIFDI